MTLNILSRPASCILPLQVLERKAPPTFPIVVEIRDRSFYVAHVGVCVGGVRRVSVLCLTHHSNNLIIIINCLLWLVSAAFRCLELLEPAGALGAGALVAGAFFARVLVVTPPLTTAAAACVDRSGLRSLWTAFCRIR